MRAISIILTLLLFSSCMASYRAKSSRSSSHECAHGCKTGHKDHSTGNHDHKAEAAVTPDVANAEDTKNAVCPVSGEPVNGQDFVVYEGKKYGLCCADCKDTFLKDPATYLKTLEKK